MIAAFVLSIPLSAFAQTPPKETVQQSQLWLQGFSNVRLNEKWSVPLEVQVRRAQTGLTWQGLLVRAGLIRDINPRFSVGGGYANQLSWRYGPFAPVPRFIEHRAFEQVTVREKFGSNTFEQRIRVEQRWVQKTDPVRQVALDDYTYQNRVR